MATSTAVASSNAVQEKELKLLKQIKIEQNFSKQAYANFKSVKFGIASCCYTDFATSIIEKQLCDWQNSASNKVVVATEDKGLFVEPLAKVNLQASMSCPTTPSNVCTVLDLADILADEGTYTQCFENASATWTVTHNLGKFPSVSVVDTADQLMYGDTEYFNENSLTITFSAPFSGKAYLN